MRKRILHLIPSFHEGGSETQALQLVRMLVDDGSYEIGLACLDKSGVLLDEVQNLRLGEIPEFPLSSFYELDTVRQLRRFAAFLKRSGTDIVQTHDFYSNIFGIFGARLAGVPVRIAAKRETGMRTPLQSLVERRAFAMANSVVVNSNAVRDYLCKSGVPNEKIEVVYNGLDTARFELNGLDPVINMKELGLPVDPPMRLVTMVANLHEPVKNHAMFLRAATAAAVEMKDVGFVIAGEGSLMEETKQLAVTLGIGERTFFLGRCVRVPELLALSEVCVLTSRSEGFANSILEYMAAGKPVVATDVGGAREAIVDGVTGYLVASDNDFEFARKLVELLRDPQKGALFGSRGRARAAEQFSAAAQRDGNLAVYQRELALAAGRDAVAK